MAGPVVPTSSPKDEDIVICCSGGGIRSASFCLGGLQSLQRDAVFEHVRTITAVSGGGYIAAAHALTHAALIDAGVATAPEPLPPDTTPQAYAVRSPEETHLRDNTRYLVPDAPLAVFGLSAVLLGITINAILFGGLLFVGSTVLGWLVSAAGVVTGLGGPDPRFHASTWVWAVPAASAAAGLLLSWFTYLRHNEQQGPAPVGRRLYDVWSARKASGDAGPRMLRWFDFGTAAVAVNTSWALARFAVAWAVALIGLPWTVVWLYAQTVPGRSGAWTTVLNGLGFGSAVGVGQHAVTAASFLGAVVALTRVSIGKIRTFTKDLTDGSASGRALTAFGRAARDVVAPYLGVVVVLLGALAFALMFLGRAARHPLVSDGRWDLAGVFACVAVLAAVAALKGSVDINHTSLHRYYRDRLAAAYAEVRADGAPAGAGLATKLSALHRPGMPEIVLCAAAASLGTGDLPPGRNAVSYTFTPTSVGLSLEARARSVVEHQRVATVDQEQAHPTFTLFDAVAVSGAAVSPLMGHMTRPGTRVLFALANVRLGMWLPSAKRVEADLRRRTTLPTGRLQRPRRAALDLLRRFGEPDIGRLWAEMAGRMQISGDWLYVTDGGHYENLGLVEALRRRPDTVFVLDASGDAQNSFTTIGQAIALARAECGAYIDLDPSVIRPTTDREVERTVVRGTFRYADDPDRTRTLIYAKLGVTAQHPWDVRAYLRTHANFPTTSTVQQLYDSTEFEAYRAMGETTGEQMLAAYVDARRHPPRRFPPTSVSIRIGHPPTPNGSSARRVTTG